jgi:hypothetical protein
MAKEKNLLDGVVRFIGTEGFSEAIQQRLLAHVEPACIAAGVKFEDLPRMLEQQVYALMFTCVVEDLMSRPAPDGRNLTDAYIKRHGWKLGGSARRQLKAVRDSRMGLYEITATVPGRSITLRDLVGGAPDVAVEAPGLANALPVGCPLGARVLRVDSTTTIAGGLLPFEEGMSAEAAEAVRAAAGTDDNLAEYITAFWLRKTLEENLGAAGGTAESAPADGEEAATADETQAESAATEG